MDANGWNSFCIIHPDDVHKRIINHALHNRSRRQFIAFLNWYRKASLIPSIIFRGVVDAAVWQHNSTADIAFYSSLRMLSFPTFQFESHRPAQFITFWSCDRRTRTASSRSNVAIVVSFAAFISAAANIVCYSSQRHETFFPAAKPRQVSFARFNYVESENLTRWGRSPLERRNPLRRCSRAMLGNFFLFAISLRFTWTWNLQRDSCSRLGRREHTSSMFD